MCTGRMTLQWRWWWRRRLMLQKCQLPEEKAVRRWVRILQNVWKRNTQEIAINVKLTTIVMFFADLYNLRLFKTCFRKRHRRLWRKRQQSSICFIRGRFWRTHNFQKVFLQEVSLFVFKSNKVNVSCRKMDREISNLITVLWENLFLITFRHPKLNVRSNLTDCHMYIMKKWILDFLMQDR